VLGGIYMCSEIFLAFSRRAPSDPSDRKSADRYSFPLLWILIGVGVFAGIVATNIFRFAAMLQPIVSLIGVALFLAGVLLRWYSIVHLGRFFTVDVAIAAGHKVIETGPYRFVRHPSYTGALLAFVGFGLCLRNWMAVLLLLIPITAAFLWRIKVEERALHDALGDGYGSYAARTKRLIPFVY
jgi:protein-S-isoprenylcysteine O-methyltransferase